MMLCCMTEKNRNTVRKIFCKIFQKKLNIGVNFVQFAPIYIM